MKRPNTSFIIRNLLKGLFWLSIFVGIFLLARKTNQINFLKWMGPVFENTPLIISIFLVSEVIIGIIPPEIFIIWALRHNEPNEFLTLVAMLACISYGAGILGYFIGYYLNRSLYYRFIKRKFLKNLDHRLQTFGMYLMLIAALTPVPFSGVSMLIGSIRYPFRKYLLFSIARFIRFGILALVFWQANINF